MNKKIETIGIVIAHFGRKVDTFECIASISRNRPKNMHSIIYLVDNDPENRILSSELSFTLRICLIVSKKNSGFAGGMNKGIKRAIKDGCKYILLLNNDVTVKPKLFEKLASYLKHGSADLISPIITYYDKPDTIWCMDGHLNKLFLFTIYPNMNKRIQDISPEEPVVSDFAAACLMIKDKVFKKIGFFDERYFLNVEDVEWCFRAKKAGFKLLYIPFPLALHKVSANTGIRGTNLLTPANAYYYARNFFIFLKDHKDSFSIFTAVVGQTFIRLPFYIVFRTNSYEAVGAYLKGYLHGLWYLMTDELKNYQVLKK